MSEAAVRLKIALCDTEPPIWRRVEVPSSITLKALHAVIQAAMGWQNSHLYQFRIGRQTVDGPGFDDGGFRDAPRLTAGRVRLDDLLAHNLKRFAYVYDMGDNWEHALRIEKVLPADPAAAYPRFVDGAGRCPPEDVGGIPGFYDFLAVLEDHEHPDHEELSAWYGGAFDPEAMDESDIRKKFAKLAKRKAG